MLNIGGEANEVNVDRAVASMERGPIRHELDEPITDQECATEINKMKITPVGDDEVNVLMIRQAAPEVREEVHNIIQKMFLGETPWDPVTIRAVVVLLCKKKGSRADLDKYRSISLLSLCSRILARVLAKRLWAAAEKHGWLSSVLWGFRSGRSVVDAAMIFRILVEEQPRESPHDDCITFSLMDIKKKRIQMFRGHCAGLCWRSWGCRRA